MSPEEVRVLAVVVAGVIVALLGSAAASPGDTAKPQPPSRPAVIDFGVDEPSSALGEQFTAPPPDVKHPSLLSDRYRGDVHANPDAELDDPLAVRTPARPARTLWLGARVGVGMFDDAATSARAGFALAASSRYRLADAVFLAARADWTRRGGSSQAGMAAMTGAVDSLGASAGAGINILGRSPAASPDSPGQPARLALALIAQLRADLRLTDHRDDAPVRRAGLGIAAGAELALPSTPFTLGARFEQSITELAPGARDRAVLVEVGIDLR